VSDVASAEDGLAKDKEVQRTSINQSGEMRVLNIRWGNGDEENTKQDSEGTDDSLWSYVTHTISSKVVICKNRNAALSKKPGLRLITSSGILSEDFLFPVAMNQIV
jgi:hypothetical protein